jgi:transaldolase
MQKRIDELKIKLFADGANIDGMVSMANLQHISGLTTNPTLMRKAGITDYQEFAKEVLEHIKDKPISFEVFSDDINEMKIQGRKLAALGKNVNVKIPITNTKGESTFDVVRYLGDLGISVNVTAVMTVNQVESIISAINSETANYISVFAGRIADTGQNPIPIMLECLELLNSKPNSELIWASPRELLNIFQAEEIGCHVITATNDILDKLRILGKDLDEYSRETVLMFHEDAQKSGFTI